MRNFILSFLILYIPLWSFSQIVVDRGPYLQMGTPNSMVIKWRTEDPTESIVWYGLSSDNLNLQAQTPGTTTDHEVFLTGLNTYTKYYYAIGDHSGILAGDDDNFYFRTSPAEGSETPFIAWVQGDAGTGNSEQRQTRDGFLNYLGDQHLDLMLFLGDNAYSDGRQSEYHRAYFDDMYEDIIYKSVMWHTIGNHDAHKADSENESGPYYDIFTMPRNGEAGGVPSGTEAYYSYNYANAHFVVLNSVDLDRSADSPQAQWLEEDLSNNHLDWTIAYFHHPMYSGSDDNLSDDGNEEVEMRENFLPILEAHGVDLILFGDTHNYQRSMLIRGHHGTSDTFDPETMAIDQGSGRLEDESPYIKLNPDGGAVFVVCGSAAKLEGSTDDLQHPTMYYNLAERGSAALEISGPQLDFTYILQDGTIADNFTILKELNPLGVEITAPDNGDYYQNLQYVNITADASDSDGDVVHVAFYVDETLVGIDYNAPYNAYWHPLYSGIYTIKAVATDDDGFTKSDVINLQFGQTTTTCTSVDQSTDDAEEKESGYVNVNSSDLELVEDGSNHQTVGVRFTGLDIPRGAAISSAFLNFTVKTDDNKTPCEIEIYGQADGDPETFESSSDNLSDRAKTNASATWNPSNWSNNGDNRSSPDIRAVIQEIVLQEDYSSGNPIVLLLEGEGRRTAISYDHDPDEAPRLCISFDPNICYDSDLDGTCDMDDVCPGFPEPGFPCNDNYSGTFNDIVTSDCICQGTLYDCPDLAAQIGAPCDDNYAGTYDDTVTSDCDCVGTLYDCPDLAAQFGAPCDDDDEGTYDDTVTPDCDCVGIPFDCPDLQLPFGTACDDDDPTTYNDIITGDCECVGTPYDCPDLLLNAGTPCNDNNPFTCYDVITGNCTCEGTPTSGFTTKTIKINHSYDDAEERPSGYVTVSSGDLELVRDGSETQLVGLRFTNLGLESNVSISSAYVQFAVDETNNSNPSNMVIYGEANTNAPAFSSSSENISNRIRTNASVEWSPESWNNVGEQGTGQQTTDLTPILQEVMSMNGFTSSSPLVLIIEGEGRRVAEAYDGVAALAPRLSITYNIILPDIDGDGICDDEDHCFGPEPGSPCNDFNAATYDDIIQSNCFCEGTPYDCPDLGVNIGTPCDDGFASTFDDVVDANCNCTGTFYDCINLQANVGDSCDDGDPFTVNDQVNSSCECEGQPPTEVQICGQIEADSDDAEQRSNGTVGIASSDLELAEDNGDEQVIGMRFTTMDLQQGTFISSAWLQFTVDKANNEDPCNLTIYGELSTDAATFQTSSDNLSDRASTNASALWSPDEWLDNGDSGPAQRSVDISAIVQEIVNQPGFGPDSPIVLFISGEGLRQAVSHDESSQNAAELCVTALISSPAPLATPGGQPGITAQQSITTATPEKGEERSQLAESSTLYQPFLKIFPNPAKNEFAASFNTQQDGMVLLQVVDKSGMVLLQREEWALVGYNQFVIQVEDLPNGLYFLTLQSGSAPRHVKFHLIK